MKLVVLRKTEYKGCHFFDCENDIFLLQFDEGVHFELDGTVDMVNAGINFISNQKRRIITDFTGRTNVFSSESRKFVARDTRFNNIKICDAFVIDSYFSSILAGVYLKVFQPKTKTKVFSNSDDAIEWALQQ